MKELLKKIEAIKSEIEENNTEKKGYNDFSKYYYFTPEQIDLLVKKYSKVYKIFNKFELIRNDLGIFGQLTIFDLESDANLIYKMATDIPIIKATNIAQQLGGAMTYTKRYMLMNAFDISDNNLDFDTPQKNKKQVPKKENSDLTPDGNKKTWLNVKDLDKVIANAKAKNIELKDMRNWFMISKDVYSQLEKLM